MWAYYLVANVTRDKIVTKIFHVTVGKNSEDFRKTIICPLSTCRLFWAFTVTMNV